MLSSTNIVFIGHLILNCDIRIAITSHISTVPYAWSTVQLSLSLARGYGTGWLSLAVSKHNESWSCFRIALMAPTRPAGSLRGGSFKEPCVPGAPATTNTSKGSTPSPASLPHH